MLPTVADLFNFVEKLIHEWGPIIIFVGAFLENSVILGFIVPGVTIIFLSGFVARTTNSDLALILILAILGSFLGDNFDYYLGRKMGKVLAKKPLFSKSIALVSPIVKKGGVLAIFGGRFSAWSRAWVALSSGAIGFSYIKFALASLASAIVWCSAWIVGGYLLGGNKELIELWLGRATILIWVTILVVFVYYFRTRIKLVLEIFHFWLKKYGRKFKK